MHINTGILVKGHNVVLDLSQTRNASSRKLGTFLSHILNGVKTGIKHKGGVSVVVLILCENKKSIYHTTCSKCVFITKSLVLTRLSLSKYHIYT